VYKKFWPGNLNRGNFSEGLDVDWRMISRVYSCLKEMSLEGVEWIHMAQDRDHLFLVIR
jgi:hypothetical protein